jgi:ubiquinone/menaquinone biosynthesis C-methylase UbiE
MMAGKPADVVEEGYDTIASVYHNQRDRFKSDEVLGSFISLLPPGGEVLDVGCGAGIPVVRFLVDAGFKVAGVDISTSMLKLARVHVPEAQ